jgi:hypothetical protein
MSDGQQANDLLRRIRAVDDPIIAHTNAVTGGASELHRSGREWIVAQGEECIGYTSLDLLWQLRKFLVETSFGDEPDSSFQALFSQQHFYRTLGLINTRFGDGCVDNILKPIGLLNEQLCKPLLLRCGQGSDLVHHFNRAHAANLPEAVSKSSTTPNFDLLQME